MNAAPRPGGSWLAIAATAVGLVLLGCGSYRPEPSKANLAESAAVSRQLEALPGVVEVDGGYARDLEDPGSADFGIGVSDRADLDTTADKAIEAVWRSTLDPIGSMSVLVARHDEPTIKLRRHVDFTRDKTSLERRYGPRP